MAITLVEHRYRRQQSSPPCFCSRTACLSSAAASCGLWTGNIATPLSRGIGFAVTVGEPIVISPGNHAGPVRILNQAERQARGGVENGGLAALPHQRIISRLLRMSR